MRYNLKYLLLQSSNQFLLGFPFLGTLFVGFMITSSGPRVLEYNVRFGDPETEALMVLLHDDVDLVALLLVRPLGKPFSITQFSEVIIGLCRAPPRFGARQLQGWRCRYSYPRIRRISIELSKRQEDNLRRRSFKWVSLQVPEILNIYQHCRCCRVPCWDEIFRRGRRY